MKESNADKVLWVFFTVFGLIFVVVGLVVGLTVGMTVDDILFSIIFTSVFCGVGMLFAIIGIVALSREIKKEKLIKWLIANGRVIWGKVTHVDVDRSLTVNGRHPYLIYAEYEDEGIVTTLYKFKSRHVWLNSVIVTPGSSVKIYVNPQDMSQHYMDVHSIQDDSNYANVVDFT